MRASIALSAFALAISGANAYFDGYMNVSSAVEPLQIRLAYAKNFDMMGKVLPSHFFSCRILLITSTQVSWNTFSKLRKPTVRYGLDKSLRYQVSSNVSVTYPTSLTYNNHVELPHLLPHTTYYYLPENSKSNEPYNFTTSRAPGDDAAFSVALVVDMGTFGALGLSDHVGNGAANPLKVNEQTTIQSMVGQLDDFDFLLHAGDIAYADYWLKEEIGGYLPNSKCIGPLLRLPNQ